LTSDGRCLQRKDKESVPISSENISFSRIEIISREYDRAFVDSADIADLNYSLIKQVAEHISKGMSVEKCLQHLELAEFDGSRFRLRRASLLLFAKNPSKWHPRLQVRILVSIQVFQLILL
jgi:ATP-dependent DNA helicase RecG